MGKMHKEIAKFLTQSAEDEDVADEDIIKVGHFMILRSKYKHVIYH